MVVLRRNPVPDLLAATLLLCGLAPGFAAESGAALVVPDPCTERARAGAAVDLARLGDWAIVVGVEAIASERFAAEELRDLLAAAGAGELPIVDEAQPRDDRIYLGFGPAMRASPVGFAPDDELGEEGFRVVAGDRAIAIAGGRPRGTLYGVYTFAEEHLGVRFLTADHTHVPPVAGRPPLGPLDRTWRPVFQFRAVYSGELTRPRIGARLRLNALIHDDPAQGGVTGYRLINHSMQNLLPTRRYGAAHPEWYALRDGQRRWDVAGRDWAWDGTEPCCSNPEVIATVTENTLAAIAEHPERRNVSVSQNDNDLYCECAACAAIDEAEGSHMGSLLRMVNAVADAVAERHPEVMVGTLAYRYSRQPPQTTVPRENVQIQLASIEACQYHALGDADCPANAAFARDLRAWSAICDEIYLWHYVVSFRNYLMPCANYHHLGEDVRFLAAHHVKGVMAQAAWNHTGGEFAELRNYVIARMLWDPTRDPRVQLREFVDLHYGAAAPHVHRLLAFLTRRARLGDRHPMCLRGIDAFGLDRDDLAVMSGILDAARAAAGSDAVRERIAGLAVSVPACELALEVEALRRAARGEEAPDAAAVLDRATIARLSALVRRIDAAMERHGISGVAEGLSRERFREYAGRFLQMEFDADADADAEAGAGE